MYAVKIQTREEIEDFKIRFRDIEKNLPRLQEELDEVKEQYRRLKKLQYNLTLAQNEQYCYGPEYMPKTAEEQEELWRAVTEHKFNEMYLSHKELER